MAPDPASLFERDPAVVTSPYIEGPPLTDEMVAHAEQVLGVRLPAAYVDLMRNCNGGYTAGSWALPTGRPTSWAPDHVAFRHIAGIPPVDDGDPDGSGVLATPYMTREWGLPEGLVLLTGDGPWWIALDYRECGPVGEPGVSWLDVEMDEDVPLADSFEAFLAGLVPASDVD